MVKITKTKHENSRVKTLTFEENGCLEATPGQFLMVWIPGMDEVPMSISCLSAEGVSISVERVGQATQALHNMKKGDLIGVRGPFGNGFSLTEKGNILIVGGGTGLIPLTFLGEQLANSGVRMTLMAGARTKDDLIFLERIESIVQKVHGKMTITTDDGSFGTKGMITQPAEDLLREENLDMVYACGPEPMLHKMLCLAEEYAVQLEMSLERLMRCAVGICGSCMLGEFRVCMDGPVFTKEQLHRVKRELGRFKLDFDGKRVTL